MHRCGPLLSRNVRFPRISDAIENDWLEAVAVTAAGYGSARSMSFFQAADRRGPGRERAAGAPSNLNLDHLMASIAVPMIFPPVQIAGEFSATAPCARRRR